MKITTGHDRFSRSVQVSENSKENEGVGGGGGRNKIRSRNFPVSYAADLNLCVCVQADTAKEPADSGIARQGV